MDHRTDKQAALDDTGAWILKKLEKRFGEERLGLNTQEIGQVLDSVMGPAYDDKGTPTPQRQDPAEAARRLICPGRHSQRSPRQDRSRQRWPLVRPPTCAGGQPSLDDD